MLFLWWRLLLMGAVLASTDIIGCPESDAMAGRTVEHHQLGHAFRRWLCFWLDDFILAGTQILFFLFLPWFLVKSIVNIGNIACRSNTCQYFIDLGVESHPLNLFLFQLCFHLTYRTHYVLNSVCSLFAMFSLAIQKFLECTFTALIAIFTDLRLKCTLL